MASSLRSRPGCTVNLNQLNLAAAARQREEQNKRLALEQQLQASDQTHHKALTDAQDGAAGCTVPVTPTTSGVVHGAPRARLDPAHAQRIVCITDEDDQGLLALAACQAYMCENSG
ncbi:hypothetical protein C4K23_2086 [Pseudomonas chlororaphis]|nr:hypothetical protein C4K23_2086 [Pseudomonas chlororaphis]